MSKPVRQIVYLSVNAGDAKSTWAGQYRQSPPVLKILHLMGTVLVDRYTAEKKLRPRAALETAAHDLQAELYYIEIEIGALCTDPEFAALVELPTSFDLRPEEMRVLRCVSRHLLAQSSEYQRLITVFGER